MNGVVVEIDVPGWPPPKAQDFGTVLRSFQAAMRDDPAFAWTWHCAVATCVLDEGIGHAAANRAAARFMKLAFGVDTSTPPQ